MDTSPEINKYIKEPDLLLKLVQDIFQIVEANYKQQQDSEMEAQLVEISRTIEKLEKMGVSIPDGLRAEKIRLATTLGSQSEASVILIQLTDGLEDILHAVRIRTMRKPEQLTIL